MRRLYICLAIISAVVVLSRLSLLSMKRSTEALDAAALACIASCDNDDGMIFDRISELMICWEDYYKKVSVITRSSSLEELAVSVSRLNYLAASNEGDLRSELSAIIYRADIIYENQRPVLQSIL
ncbi:MAG: DUF4363 family protein [Ruminococcus sp.]|nr:DUF4363 family protein [Ruminococcus sp.]